MQLRDTSLLVGALAALSAGACSSLRNPPDSPCNLVARVHYTTLDQAQKAVMSLAADGPVAVQVITGNISAASLNALKRAFAGRGFLSQGTIETRYNLVFQFFREPVSIAEFGIPELVDRAERLMWQARIPHDWELSMGQTLIVPRKFAARAKEILDHDPVLGSDRVDQNR